MTDYSDEFFDQLRHELEATCGDASVQRVMLNRDVREDLAGRTGPGLTMLFDRDRVIDALQNAIEIWKLSGECP
jgi:hypothetical protein